VRALEGITVILSSFTLSWAILQPITGHLSDRIGRKKITVLGLAGSALTILILMSISNYLIMVFFSLILGFEVALFYTPLVAMVSDIAPSEVEGTFIGSYRFFRDLGYFFGPILLGKIADMYSLDYSIYTTSVIILLSVILLIFTLKEPARV
jgi:MFS family permease